MPCLIIMAHALHCLHVSVSGEIRGGAGLFTGVVMTWVVLQLPWVNACRSVWAADASYEAFHNLQAQVQLLGQSISVGRPSGYVDPSRAQEAATAAAAALQAFQVWTTHALPVVLVVQT